MICQRVGLLISPTPKCVTAAAAGAVLVVFIKHFSGCFCFFHSSMYIGKIHHHTISTGRGGDRIGWDGKGRKRHKYIYMYFQCFLYLGHFICEEKEKVTSFCTFFGTSPKVSPKRCIPRVLSRLYLVFFLPELSESSLFNLGAALINRTHLCFFVSCGAGFFLYA